MSTLLQKVVKNKTAFCLFVIFMLTSFFFARSIVVRGKWIVPTFLSYSPHMGTAGTQLAPVNNWLKEGIFNLRFSAYRYPHSVETSAPEKRGFYASILPGSQFPIYFLFKLLDFTGIVPDIYEKRGTQILLIIFWNYFLHFSLALVLCISVFFICRRMGFDHLNATLIAIVPSIVQFHNGVSLYWHHLSLFHDISVLLPIALFVFFEVLRNSQTSLRILLLVRVAQPLLMFIGILISWVFVFFILTVYSMRIIRKEIQLPVSFQYVWPWAKKSFLFFVPSLAAVLFWIYQIVGHMQSVSHGKLSSVATSGDRLDLMTSFLFRTGFNNGLEYVVYYLKTSFFTHLLNGYGIVSIGVLYASFYIATHGRKFILNKTEAANLAARVYLMFFVPCVAVYVFFAQTYADHQFSPILLSPALSIGFAFAPIFILQVMKKDYLMPALVLFNKKTITLAALLGITPSIMYGYSQIHHKSIIKLFSPPAYWHVSIGNFIKDNTDYKDVVFSKDYNIDVTGHNLSVTHFHNKLIHFASNLDWIYYKTKLIEDDYTIKILYFNIKKTDMEQTSNFLNNNNVKVSSIEEKNAGYLLSFNGKEFRTWYEQVHECSTYPQRCDLDSNSLKLDLSGHRRLLKW